MAFIEQRGLAAWLSRAADHTGSGNAGTEVAAPSGDTTATRLRRSDLILALAELVLGAEKELHDDR
jgi:hypothetical protein